MAAVELLRGLLALVLLGAFCAAAGAVLHLDAAALPLPVLAGTAVALYLAGLAGVLSFGLALCYLGLLAGTVFCAVRAGVQKCRAALCSPGLLLFLAAGALVWVLFAVTQPLFTQWDEFTAWGLAPKMVAERAAFYVADPINLTASFTYPGTSLVSYFFQATPGQFAEWQCLAGLDILFLACMAPLAALPRKQWMHGVLLCGTAALLPFFFSVVPVGTPSTVYANAMADTPLALLFGGSLCLYYAIGDRKLGFALTALPLALLALTKDIGLAYGMIAAFLIGIDQLCCVRRQSRLKTFGFALLKAGALAVVVLAAFLSWGRYTAAVAPTGGAASVGSAQLSYGAVLVGGLQQLLGFGRQARFSTLLNLMAAAFTQRRVCLLGTPAVAVAGIALVAAAAFFTAPKKTAQRRRVVGAFAAGLFCFGALYLFHLILYFYNFSEAEALALKDYERYIGPYLQGWLLAMLCVLGRSAICARRPARQIGSAAIGLAALGMAGVFVWRGLPVAGFWSDANSLYTVRADIKNRAEAMNEVLTWDDRVLVISQGDDATRWYYYKYELTAKVADGYGGIWWGNEDTSHRWPSDFMNLVESLNWELYENEAVCTVDSLAAYLQEIGCNYVLIDRADDYLERDFSARFAGGLTADMPATLYHFEGKDVPVAFTPVAVAESGVAP